MENSITLNKKVSKMNWKLKQIRDRVFDFELTVYDENEDILWGASSVITFPQFVVDEKREK